MKKNSTISMRLIESAYKPRFKYLFSCAYLITGNERTAESVLMKVMLAHPAYDDKEFVDIVQMVKDLSMKAAKPEDNALFAFAGDMSDITLPLSEWILTLDEKIARVLVLRYSIGLSVKEITLVTGDRTEKIRSILERAKVRASSNTKGQKNVSSLIRAACEEVMTSACFPPDFSAILRSVERIIEDKNTQQQRSISVKPVISWIVTGILMIFVTAIIWMTVVLIDYFREPVKAVNPVFPIYTAAPENTEG